MAAPKPKNAWGTIRRLLGYMKKSGFLIVLSVAVAIAGTVMQVINPKMLGNATTVIFEGIKQGTGIDFSALGTILLFVGLLYAGVFVTCLLYTSIREQQVIILFPDKRKTPDPVVPAGYAA